MKDKKEKAASAKTAQCQNGSTDYHSKANIIWENYQWLLDLGKADPFPCLYTIIVLPKKF